MADKTLVTPADHRSMQISYGSDEDVKRAKAIVCAARNIEDPRELLELLQMLGLVDEQGKFISLADMPSYMRNASRGRTTGKGKAWN